MNRLTDKQKAFCEQCILKRARLVDQALLTDALDCRRVLNSSHFSVITTILNDYIIVTFSWQKVSVILPLMRVAVAIADIVKAQYAATYIDNGIAFMFLLNASSVHYPVIQVDAVDTAFTIGKRKHAGNGERAAIHIDITVAARAQVKSAVDSETAAVNCYGSSGAI